MPRLLLIVFLTFPIFSAMAQNPGESEDSSFFIAPLVEVSGYSRKGLGLGGGFALGGGDGVAIGLRGLYSFAPGDESITALELTIFMRFYLQGSEATTGPFVQLNAGTAMFAYKENVSFPAEASALSLGLAFGWRFPLGNRWYMEPAVRAGYPYIAGLGVAAAFRL